MISNKQNNVKKHNKNNRRLDEIKPDYYITIIAADCLVISCNTNYNVIIDDVLYKLEGMSFLIVQN